MGVFDLVKRAGQFLANEVQNANRAAPEADPQKTDRPAAPVAPTRVTPTQTVVAPVASHRAAPGVVSSHGAPTLAGTGADFFHPAALRPGERTQGSMVKAVGSDTASQSPAGEAVDFLTKMGVPIPPAPTQGPLAGKAVQPMAPSTVKPMAGAAPVVTPPAAAPAAAAPAKKQTAIPAGPTGGAAPAGAQQAIPVEPKAGTYTDYRPIRAGIALDRQGTAAAKLTEFRTMLKDLMGTAEGAAEPTKVQKLVERAGASAFRAPGGAGGLMPRNWGEAQGTTDAKGVYRAIPIGNEAEKTLQFDSGKQMQGYEGQMGSPGTVDKGRWSPQMRDFLLSKDSRLLNHPDPESLLDSTGNLTKEGKAELQRMDDKEKWDAARKEAALDLQRKQNGMYTDQFVGRHTGTIRSPDGGAVAASQAAFDKQWGLSAEGQADRDLKREQTALEQHWKGNQAAMDRDKELLMQNKSITAEQKKAILVGTFGMAANEADNETRRYETDTRARVDTAGQQTTRQTAIDTSAAAAKSALEVTRARGEEDRKTANVEGPYKVQASAASGSADDSMVREFERQLDDKAIDVLDDKGIVNYTASLLQQAKGDPRRSALLKLYIARNPRITEAFNSAGK